MTVYLKTDEQFLLTLALNGINANNAINGQPPVFLSAPIESIRL